MAVREILIYPQARQELRQKSSPVLKVDEKVRRLIQDLNDTLKASLNGIGLAAPQINRHQRVVVVCLGEGEGKEWNPGPPVALVNPQVLESGDERKDFDGCLSFPGLYGKTKRPHYLRVKGLDHKGKPFDRIFRGFNAVAVHHEIDHLDGILFIDRVENIHDLYRIEENERGEQVSIPV